MQEKVIKVVNGKHIEIEGEELVQFLAQREKDRLEIYSRTGRYSANSGA